MQSGYNYQKQKIKKIFENYRTLSDYKNSPSTQNDEWRKTQETKIMRRF